MTSGKVTLNTQVAKPTPAGQNRKPLDKGKDKPQGKIKRSIAKMTPKSTTTTSSSANL